MKKNSKLMLITILSLMPYWVYSQSSTSDCEGAITICSDIYYVSSPNIGQGFVNDLTINYSGCLDNGETNSMWFRIDIQSSGQLLFDIIPDSPADYDFAVFQSPNDGIICNGIASGVIQDLRCNFSAVSQDTTGLRAGYSNFSSSPSAAPFSAPINALAGETFFLVIDKFSSGTVGYTLDFSSSTASISDTSRPEMVAVSQGVGCQINDSILVSFNERIDCDLVEVYNFRIVGGTTVSIEDAIPQNCQSDDLISQVMLVFNPPLTSNNTYQIIPRNIFDLCGNRIDSNASTLTITVSDSSSCSIPDPSGGECSCVWPGDINYDGVANNFDVLGLGIAFGSTGQIRASASLNWEAQESENWIDTFYNDVNYKHADCDGDGLIDYSDTLAVSLNYGLSHNKSSSGGAVADPPLYLDLPDTIRAGETVNAALICGSQAMPIASLYGLAFSVNYDNALVDSSSSFSFDNSWLGTPGSDLLTFSKNLHANGKTDIALARIDQMNVQQQQGQIGTAHIVIKDDVSGKGNGAITLNINIDNILAITADETIVELSGESSSVVVLQKGVGIEEAFDRNKIKIYPNPAHGQINIRSEEMMEEVALLDIYGKVISRKIVNENTHRIDTEGLAAGTYLIRVSNSEASGYFKVLVY
ncbi:MAG: T9SS type A sorting domain-containing protein [Chitinophagales bacterium]